MEEPRVTIEDNESHKFELAVQKLLDKGAIEECSWEQGQFLSSYFLIPKKDGSDRFILNLKLLNEFITPSHFKMEYLRTARGLIFQDYYLANLDMKDAYYLLLVHPSSRTFLRFRFREKIYRFRYLVFGLCTCPYVFTKVLKPVMKCLRARGFKSVVYLDDILCVEDSKDKYLKNVEATVGLLETLGFLINKKKSNLRPEKRCSFQGFTIDS